MTVDGATSFSGALGATMGASLGLMLDMLASFALRLRSSSDSRRSRSARFIARVATISTWLRLSQSSSPDTRRTCTPRAPTASTSPSVRLGGMWGAKRTS